MAKKVHDFQINQDVQKVFTRHKINLEHVNFTARGGVVYIEGTIRALNNDALDSVSSKTMEIADIQINAVIGVRRVRYSLMNFSRTDAGWRHIKFVKSESRPVWKVSSKGLSKMNKSE